MKTKLYLALLGAVILTVYSSCQVLDIKKDIEFDLTFHISGNNASITETYLLSAAEYSSVINDYKNLIKSIEVKSATYYLTSFNGPDDQTISNGLLTVADENGTGSQVLASIPSEVLKPLLTTEKTLNVEQAGVDRLEELIKNPPNKCLTTLSGDINSVPVDFTVVFHIVVTMTANPL